MTRNAEAFHESRATPTRNRLVGQLCTLLGGLVLLLAMTLATRAHLMSYVAPHDDAYITFRYVDNLFNGKGLVYNQAERVFGVSSPLYLLWLCILKLFMPSLALPVLAVRFNVTFFLLTAAAVYTIIHRWTERPLLACAAAALFCVNETLLRDSLGGMESFMFSALMLWSLYFISCGEYTSAALLSGLSALARPEGVLVAATCAITWLIAGRRNVVGYLLALCLPVLFWLGFAEAYFGTIIPHSILAKARPLYPLPNGAGLAQMVDQVTAWTFGDRLWTLRAITPTLALEFAGIAMLVMVGSITLRARKAWAVALLFALFMGFYSMTNALVLPWYVPPIYALWFVLLVVGLPLAVEWLNSRWFPKGIGDRFIGALRYVPLALVLTCSTGDGIKHALASQWIIRPSAVRLRIVGYERAARWMNLHFPFDTTVAAPEIGALGYYWKGRVLDACGLVSPEALPFLPVPADQRDSPVNAPISRDLVKKMRPGAVATLNAQARWSLLSSPWFLATYELVHREPLPEPIWNSPDVLVYRLRQPIE